MQNISCVILWSELQDRSYSAGTPTNVPCHQDTRKVKVADQIRILKFKIILDLAILTEGI